VIGRSWVKVTSEQEQEQGLNIPKVLGFYSHERFYSSPFLVRAGIAQMEIHLIGWSRRHSEGLNIPKVLDFYSHERFYSSPFLVRAGKSGSTERNTGAGPMKMWEKTGGMRRRGREIGVQ